MRINKRARETANAESRIALMGNLQLEHQRATVTRQDTFTLAFQQHAGAMQYWVQSLAARILQDQPQQQQRQQQHTCAEIAGVLNTGNLRHLSKQQPMLQQMVQIRTCMVPHCRKAHQHKSSMAPVPRQQYMSLNSKLRCARTWNTQPRNANTCAPCGAPQAKTIDQLRKNTPADEREHHTTRLPTIRTHLSPCQLVYPKLRSTGLVNYTAQIETLGPFNSPTYCGCASQEPPVPQRSPTGMQVCAARHAGKENEVRAAA